MVSIPALGDPLEDPSTEEWKQRRADLQDIYHFYIMNPSYTKGVEYSLWIREEGDEYLIMSSNTGGFTTFSSRSIEIGTGIEPTETFLNLVGWGFHEAMCFMPDIYFRGEHFQNTVERIDDKARGYEVWAAGELIALFAHGQNELTPELEPLARWAGEHTEFGLPILGQEPSGGDGDGD